MHVEEIMLGLAELETGLAAAAMRAGAGEAAAYSLARATADAEASGQPALGIAHFSDYLAGLREGRIRGDAVPAISRPAPALIKVDAGGGLAHPGFDLALDDLARTAGHFGVAIFAQRNAYTCGALGYFAARLARRGLAALAATNGPALMAGAGSSRPVYCTNPFAFAAPRAGRPPLVIDQSSSATAFVNIRRAAREGRPIPEGWAIDAEGRPTTDAGEAMNGALLAFGGARGANIALLVEVLAAGMTGANWSLDAPSFQNGSESPGSGLFVLAISPALLAPGFEARLDAHLERLAGLGVHVPGEAKGEMRSRSNSLGVTIDRGLWETITGS